MRILAVRDHSEQELRRKLTVPITDKSGPKEVDATAEDYEHVTAWYHEHDYLNDSRFVARFIASRSRKDYGSTCTHQELNQKGISREAIEKAICKCDIDQCTLARDQAARRYGEPLPTVFSEKVKVQRFLLYRGYLMKDIQNIRQNFAD